MCRWLLSLGCLFAIASTAPAAEARPHILFIQVDDQGPWTLGVAGHPEAKTPHVDSLAKDGAYLVNSFCVTPVCSPSRASLMTSRYGSEVGITEWINPKSDGDLGLDAKFVAWPQLLAKAGYRTGLIGKWHLGEKPEQQPAAHGYQYFMGFLGGGNKPMNPNLLIDGKQQVVPGCLADLVTDAALDFIRKESTQPFALSLHFREPHAPWLPTTEEDQAPFRDIDPKLPQPVHPELDVAKVKRTTREYLASIHSIDRNVGRLLAELDKLGLREKTMVIYTSDHGYNMGHHGIWHKGNGHWILTKNPPAQLPNLPAGQRPNMFDTSLRVPTVIRWPKHIQPGTVVKQTVNNLDWYPTLLAVAQVEPQADVKLRGKNFLPLLTAEKAQAEQVAWDNDLYAEYSTRHQSKTHMRCYRTPDWKLMRDFLNSGRDEFYDLAKDPGETQNLIDSQDPRVKEAIAQLHSKILAKMRDLNDPVLATIKSE